MPQFCQILDHQQTIQVIGNSVLEVQLVTIATDPTGVQAIVSVPQPAWQAGTAGALVDVVAQEIENLVTYEHVIGGTPSQDQDNNNLLQLYVDLVVRLDRTKQGLPPLDGIAHVPINSFYLAEPGIGGWIPPGTITPQAYVAAEYDRLQALAA